MPNTINSIYMSMPVPVPSVDPGPQWATDINTCLTVIDQHTHSSGSGQQITPAGISINQDLPYFNNNAITLRSVRFQAQNTPISQPTDLRCLYSSSADLYFNDSAGNQVRLTQNGGVAGTPGSIGNLLAPANVSYIAGSQTYVFQSSTATAGNIDCGGIILREIVANSKGITITPPAGLPNNYALTLFSVLPSTATKFLTVDPSGNIGDTYDVDNVTLQVSGNSIGAKPLGITRPYLGAVGMQTGSPLTSFSLPSSYTAITNMSVQITTTGRPVVISVMGSTAVSALGGGTIQASDNGSNTTTNIRLMRNDTVVAAQAFGVDLAAAGTISVYFPSTMLFIDAPASSTYTYSLQGRSDGSLSTMYNSIMKVYEL